MHQQSTLFIDSPAAPTGPSYFTPSKHHKQRRSVSSFASRQSRHSTSSSSENDDDDDDSLVNRPSLHQILINQGRGQYTLDNFGAFLQSQFCYENLAFWLASRQYKVNITIYLFDFLLTLFPFHFHIFLPPFPSPHPLPTSPHLAACMLSDFPPLPTSDINAGFFISLFFSRSCAPSLCSNQSSPLRPCSPSTAIPLTTSTSPNPAPSLTCRSRCAPSSRHLSSPAVPTSSTSLTLSAAVS